MLRFIRRRRRRPVRRFNRRGRPTLRKLARKIQRVSVRDRPVYRIYDDFNADQAIKGVLFDQYSLTTTAQYKYLGLTKANLLADIAQNEMGQGLNEGDFSGNVIKCISLTIRGQIYNIGTLADDFTNVVRLIWFWDDQSTVFNGTDYIPNEPQQTYPILATYPGADAQAGVGSVFSFYNPVTVGKGRRFKILSDRTYTLSAAGTSVHIVRQKLRLRGKMMTWVNPLNGVQAPETNIGCMMLSDSSAAPNPVFTFSLRLCYTN